MISFWTMVLIAGIAFWAGGALATLWWLFGVAYSEIKLGGSYGMIVVIIVATVCWPVFAIKFVRESMAAMMEMSDE